VAGALLLGALIPALRHSSLVDPAEPAPELTQEAVCGA
jgi:hypothetical protein